MTDLIAAAITVVGGLWAVWLTHRLQQRSKKAKPLISPPLISPPQIPPDQRTEKQRSLRRKLRLLESVGKFQATWAHFEESLDRLVGFHESGIEGGADYGETCERLAELRDTLISKLLELRSEVSYLEGSAAEVNRAERKLLQFGFRHGAERRVLAQYSHVNESVGVAWFEGDAPRREARDARLVIEVAYRRLRQEAEDLFEEIREPGEAMPEILLI